MRMESRPFVAYSPLGRGFLTGSVTTAEAFGVSDVRRNMPRFQGENLRRNLFLVEELKAHAQAENCTPAQLTLAWLLASSKVGPKFESGLLQRGVCELSVPCGGFQL
jgi:aryl-alcohol dehydrogenase-like predicted oxidoreductase